jgi:hypothetical protein
MRFVKLGRCQVLVERASRFEAAWRYLLRGNSFQEAMLMSNAEKVTSYRAWSRCLKALDHCVRLRIVWLVGIALLAAIAGPNTSFACEEHARLAHAQTPAVSAAQPVFVHKKLLSLGKVVTTATVVPRAPVPIVASGQPKAN